MVSRIGNDLNQKFLSTVQTLILLQSTFDNLSNKKRSEGDVTGNRQTKLERARLLFQKPYVKLPLILLVLLYSGFVVILIFVAIGSLYALGTLVGISIIQLVIGTFSAMGTLASASVAFLLYRNSVRGSEITIALEVPMEINMAYQIKRTLATQLPPGTTQELSENLHFDFPLVWLNGGPAGGAIVAVELTLVRPSPRPTVRDGEPSEDAISMRWEMNVAQLEERVPLDSVRLPIFASYSQNPLSIGSNESIAVVATVDLFLMDSKKDIRAPLNSWIGLNRETPDFEFTIRWKTASKDKLIIKERSFKIRPRLGKPVSLGPAAVLS